MAKRILFLQSLKDSLRKEKDGLKENNNTPIEPQEPMVVCNDLTETEDKDGTGEMSDLRNYDSDVPDNAINSNQLSKISDMHDSNKECDNCCVNEGSGSADLHPQYSLSSEEPARAQPNILITNDDQSSSNQNAQIQGTMSDSSSSDSDSDSSTSSSTSSSSAKDFSSDDSVADPNYSIPVENSLSDSESEPCQSETLQIGPLQAEQINSPLKKSRKRKPNPNKWRTNVLKRLRHAGKSFSTKGKVVRERSIKPPCDEKCRQKCVSKFSEEQRKNIFDAYYLLPDALHKRYFIAQCLEEIKPRYKYKSSDKPRKNNLAFYFTDSENRKKRVCQKFFLNTLDVSISIIKTVRNRLFETQNPVPLLDDKRGKHGNHRHVDDCIKNSARDFIRLIPRVESHYTRTDSTREYIDGGRNLSDIYRDYVALCKEKSEGYINYVMFNKIFNNEFNISFFIPKKDVCEDCSAYSNTNENEKEEIQEKYDNHLKEKEMSRLEKEKDKKEAQSISSLIVAVYDLQASLPCPKGEISTFYYVSKLNAYNFTIFNLKTKDVECFFWHEGQGNRGANEIATCVYNYISTVCSSANENVDIIFYSDNCTGQQKNKFLISMYIHVVATISNLNSITHKYLIKGHTQNENDSAHSVIERNIKKALRSGPIYTPDQYVSLIRTAKKTGRPYKVNELTHTQFQDFKSLAKDLGHNYSKNTENDIVKMNDIKIIRATKEDPGCFFYKTSYGQKDFKKVKVGPASSRALKNYYTFKKLYKTPIKISEKKKKGLLSLVDKKTIPSYYSAFYQNL